MGHYLHVTVRQRVLIGVSAIKRRLDPWLLDCFNKLTESQVYCTHKVLSTASAPSTFDRATIETVVSALRRTD